jgi:hypothetical protein
MAKFPTVRETHEFLKTQPEDLKIYGGAFLRCLGGLEAEIVTLRTSLARLAKIVVAMAQSEEMPAEPGGASGGDSGEDDLTPNAGGGGAVNPQPIAQAAPQMPPQKNGSMPMATPVPPPVVGPIVTPNAAPAK